MLLLSLISLLAVTSASAQVNPLTGCSTSDASLASTSNSSITALCCKFQLFFSFFFRRIFQS